MTIALGILFIVIGVVLVGFGIWLGKNNKHVVIQIEDIHPDVPFTDKDES